MKSTPRLLAVMRKELLQLKRDRLTFAMIVGIPIMQMLLFGYAINTDVRNLASAVANQANSHLSREFIADLGQTQVLDLQYVVDTPQEIEALLEAGRISIGIYIPPDFDRRVIDDRRAAVHLMVDAVDPTVLGVANQLRNMPLGFDSTVSRPMRAGVFEVRPYFNPERRSVVFVIPGLMGIILTLTMMLFTAVAVVREREHGNLELLINTPVSTTELMIGKVVPYIVIGIVQLTLIILVGRFLFNRATAATSPGDVPSATAARALPTRMPRAAGRPRAPSRPAPCRPTRTTCPARRPVSRSLITLLRLYPLEEVEQVVGAPVPIQIEGHADLEPVVDRVGGQRRYLRFGQLFEPHDPAADAERACRGLACGIHEPDLDLLADLQRLGAGEENSVAAEIARPSPTIVA